MLRLPVLFFCKVRAAALSCTLDIVLRYARTSPLPSGGPSCSPLPLCPCPTAPAGSPPARHPSLHATPVCLGATQRADGVRLAANHAGRRRFTSGLLFVSPSTSAPASGNGRWARASGFCAP